MSGMETATYSSTPGAILFWSYIIAALLLTSFLLHLIARASPRASRPPAAQETFATLALLSFAILSWRMLSVLILSYRLWAQAHNVSLPTNILDSFLPWSSPVAPLRLWEWSRTSTLFRDFGYALVADHKTWAWSNAALAETWVVVLFICVQGRISRVTHLWAFVAIAEILPMSFAQNLFSLMLLRCSTSPSNQGSLFISGLPWFVGGAGYSACLLLAPSSGEQLIPLILNARILLALPLVLRLDERPSALKVGSTSTAGSSRSASVPTPISQFAALAVVLSLGPVMLAISKYGLGETIAAVHSHPAVAALGDDFLLSCISWVARLALGKRAHTDSTKKSE